MPWNGMTPTISDVQEFAPAKINLSLYVTGRRPDGWHLLHSLVAFCSVGDSVRYDPNSPPGVSVIGPYGAALADHTSNSVFLAAQAVCRATGHDWRSGHLELTKNLPVASGIGGGSADAAATIRLLRRVWELTHHDVDWHDLALSLGADVPVCLAGRPAWMTGIGERIAPVEGLKDWPILLVNPGQGLATPAVFAARSGDFTPSDTLCEAIPLDASAQQSWLGQQRNDLTAAAIGLMPQIAEILDFLNQQPELCAVRMSGSGATCFGLAQNQADIAAVLWRLKAWRPGIWAATGTINGPCPN